MSAVFRDVRDESGLPPTPERLLQRSEPTLRATAGRLVIFASSEPSLTGAGRSALAAIRDALAAPTPERAAA